MTTHPMTIPRFVGQKKLARKLVVITAYDFPTAQLFDEAGVDALLVGDTLGMVFQGRPNTLGVTIEQMVYHTEMVSRAAKNALVIGDLPFLSYHCGEIDAIRNAGKLIQQGGAHAVKLEGGVHRKELIHAITNAEIPVMAHIGLTPQSIHKLGRYHVQRNEERILQDALAVEEAGAFAIVLESMPTEIARKVTQAVAIPTIGIGAGPECDGQVLVWTDALGLSDFRARFVKSFANVRKTLLDGVRAFGEDVRSGRFPDAEHSYQ